MKIHKLSQMTRGWFVGDFAPSAHVTKAAEVAVKTYAAGEAEEAHVHRVAVEVTLILSGEATLNGHHLTAGDIATLEPGEPGQFTALTQTTTVVVKTPSAVGDKFPL